MKKIGIIHTTPATVQSMKELAVQVMGDVETVNIMDDSILGDMKVHERIPGVKKRWLGYAQVLQDMNVIAVISACSTVGEIAEEADRVFQIPIYRIDEAMAEKAVVAGNKISILATMSTTLGPTERLVERKAEQAGKTVELHEFLVNGAYDTLMRGDRETHNRLITEAVGEALASSDIVILAQASMAAALGDGGEGNPRILTSPLLGMQKIARELGVKHEEDCCR